MDAMRFIEECRRMCEATGYLAPVLTKQVPAEDVVKEVEKWSTAHPRKTRQSVFLEQWPNATMYDSVLGINPCLMDDDFESHFCGKDSCAQCRREFWMQEVE